MQNAFHNVYVQYKEH